MGIEEEKNVHLALFSFVSHENSWGSYSYYPGEIPIPSLLVTASPEENKSFSSLTLP